MSSSSLSTRNVGQGSYPIVIQQGSFVKTAATALTVPCVGILATDVVLLSLVAKTASTANSGGVEIITITAGASFLATSVDAVFAGTYAYVVLRSDALVVNAP